MKFFDSHLLKYKSLVKYSLGIKSVFIRFLLIFENAPKKSTFFFGFLNILFSFEVKLILLIGFKFQFSSKSLIILLFKYVNEYVIIFVKIAKEIKFKILIFNKIFFIRFLCSKFIFIFLY